MNIRQPAVAGAFYPESADTLQSIIHDMLGDAEEHDLSPKVLIVPHAGYIYSGPVAASAYGLLKAKKRTIERVVLLGPSHQHAFEGMALPDCEQFSTPLGEIPLDIQTMQQLLTFSQIEKMDAAHHQEHSLEVQCPFLQSCLDDFKLIPIVVGNATPMAIAEIIEYLWGGDETLFIISSDLSHYHSYEEACNRDRITVRVIEELSSTLTGGQACGCHPLNGMLKVAQRRGMEVKTLDVRNSGDTAGDKERVVGYGAFVIQ